MQLRYLNNRLQYHGPNGWTIVPQAIEIIECKAIDKEYYSIGDNYFIGEGGIFVFNRNIMAKEGHSEQLGVCKKMDSDVRNAVLDLIDYNLRNKILFYNGFVVELRNNQEFLVGFYKSEDDPSFYLIKDAINALKPKDHYPYFEGHFFSPDYNPITGEYGPSKAIPVPESPIGKFTEEQVRRIFDAGVNTNLVYEGCFRDAMHDVFNEALKKEQQLAAQQISDDINPLTKPRYKIDIRLNQERSVLNFSTDEKVINPGIKHVRLGMDPYEFLNTFQDWPYVENIRVKIDT